MGIKVVFLGGIWTKEYERIVICNSIGSVQIAANVLQTNLIEGLDANLEHPVTLLNEMFLGAFPFCYKKLIIHSRKWKHNSKCLNHDYDIEFLNLPLIKHYSRLNHSKKYIRNVCQKYKKDTVYFIGYSMTYSIVEALLYAKKINPQIKTCLIVPDLPEYMNLNKKQNVIYKLLRKSNKNKLYKDIKKIDSFVVLTKYIYEALKVRKPYTVVEGIAADNNDGIVAKRNYEEKKIVYTGALAEKYGIVDLVKAFTKIDGDDLRLVICGAGDGVEFIKEAAKIDTRIQYLGIVSNEEARRIQKEAYLLVNPRNSREAYTKYSFPSKTMEYMATGNPVLMYKLKGIPDEYDDYLFYIKESIEETLKQVLILPVEELKEKGIKARRFVIEEKNKVKQSWKILNMLESI